MSLRRVDGGRGLRLRGVVAAAALFVAGLTGGSSQATGTLQIEVLSNRADLISGGDALVRVVLPSGVSASDVTMKLGAIDVTSQFAVRPNGKYQGLLTGLALGPNTLKALLPDNSGAQITITNHPGGGPVFSGPQLLPWECTTLDNGLGPETDEQCNAPTKVSFYYMPVIQSRTVDAPIGAANNPLLLPYDPQNPPPGALVAMTTTDQGVTVPYIVRVERGTLNRGIHDIAVLFDPSKPWEPWASQSGWNHKLYWVFGASCGTKYNQGNPNSGVLNDMALSRGFMVAVSSMTVLGTHCNTVLEAETVMMLKENIAEHYGEIRYTIGDGCSGGSISQHAIANTYPGLLDGIRPQCSFSDMWSIVTVDSFDCPLLQAYFARSPASLWANQVARTAVLGYVLGFQANAAGCYMTKYWNMSEACAPAEELYDPETNPDGVRCTIQDYNVAVLGRRPPDVWGPVEQRIGRGFANRMLDNVGLQYGLNALADGAITPEQFVDANEKIGCWDIDGKPIAQRCEADPLALEYMYRSGQISYGSEGAKVAEIDARTGANHDVHSNLQQQIYRARLLRANGHADNSVSWYEPEVAAIGIATPPTAEQSFIVMDKWLANVEADQSDDPIEVKIVRNKPAEATDGCVTGAVRLPDEACTTSRAYYADPRLVAGMPLTRDILKCQLKPLKRDEYSVSFTDAQWGRLQNAFPTGVCDWSKPGVGQQIPIPWLTFAGGPGGLPLGPASGSQLVSGT